MAGALLHHCAGCDPQFSQAGPETPFTESTGFIQDQLPGSAFSHTPLSASELSSYKSRVGNWTRNPTVLAEILVKHKQST